MELTKVETMTVGQLKEWLNNFDHSMPVLFAHPSNDYWNTTIAREIGDGMMEQAPVVWSDYHSAYTLPPLDLDEDQGDTWALVIGI